MKRQRDSKLPSGAELLEHRNHLFRSHCDVIARAHAVALLEEGGAIYAVRDGVRWLVHRAVDDRVIWIEAWKVMHYKPSVLLAPTDERRHESDDV